jgi:hypothetical protein
MHEINYKQFRTVGTVSTVQDELLYTTYTQVQLNIPTAIYKSVMKRS